MLRLAWYEWLIGLAAAVGGVAVCALFAYGMSSLGAVIVSAVRTAVGR